MGSCRRLLRIGSAKVATRYALLVALQTCGSREREPIFFYGLMQMAPWTVQMSSTLPLTAQLACACYLLSGACLAAVLLGHVLSLKVSKCEKAIELQQPREFPLVVLWVPFVGPYVLQC